MKFMFGLTFIMREENLTALTADAYYSTVGTAVDSGDADFVAKVKPWHLIDAYASNSFSSPQLGGLIRFYTIWKRFGPSSSYSYTTSCSFQLFS